MLDRRNFLSSMASFTAFTSFAGLGPATTLSPASTCLLEGTMPPLPSLSLYDQNEDAFWAALRNQLLQGGTMNILHNQKILSQLLDKVIDGNCIGVCQCGSSTSLSAKAFHSSQIIFVQGAQDFHCHDALYAVIPGLKDAGHTTGGDMFTNLIAPSNQGTVKLVQLLTSSNPRKQSTMIRYDHRGLVYH